MTSPALAESPPNAGEATGAIRITRQVVGRRTVLLAAGEIDMAATPSLEAAIATALSAGAVELWIDLTRATFIDSSGVHVLLDGHHRARRLNRRLTVIAPRGCVRRVLEITGVSTRLTLCVDRAAAHRSI